MSVLEILFWSAVGLLVYTQLLYPVLVALMATVFGRRSRADIASTVAHPDSDLPKVTLIIAAHAEGGVISDKVRNVRELDYPVDKLELIVACDGSPDDTVQRARLAGVDQVLDLPWGGKVRAQDGAVAVATGELLAFSDANSFWERGALRALVAPLLSDPKVGYVCGRVQFENADGTNQEGLYWRYEMWLRGNESRLCSVTAGNGAIYATRRESYIHVDPVMGHDLSFPFNMVKRGWRAVYAPAARAREKMVPSVEGEFRRKRRMMSHAWPIVIRGGMLSPRGYGALYGWMILSHRLLRYATPVLHAVALGTAGALAFDSIFYAVLFAGQLALLAAAGLGQLVPLRPLLVARYYVLTTAALAAGLWDWLRHGTPAGWSPPEGTR